MNEEIYNKYRMAGEVIKKVRKETIERVKVGSSLLEVAEFVENRIKEEKAEPAFPCTISLNEEAAHATPSIGDESVFGEDMVKIDMGAHIDGYIADAAVTVDLSGNEGLVKASEDALYAAIDIIKDGVNTADIGEVIEETIKSHDFRSITNLTGHGLSQYNSHAEPSIPNRKEKKGVILEEGDVIALEPFATDGVGKIFEKGSHAEIYQHVNVKPIRSRDARMLLKEIEVYKTLPFAVRWLSTNRASFALKQMERAGLVKAFPILKEKDGVLISQAEHTVIVQKDGYEITT